MLEVECNSPCNPSFQLIRDDDTGVPPVSLSLLPGLGESLFFVAAELTDSTSSTSSASRTDIVCVSAADSGLGRDRAFVDVVTPSTKSMLPRLVVRRNVRRGPIRDCSDAGSMPITVEIRLSVVVRSHLTSSTTGMKFFGEEGISARDMEVMGIIS